MKFRKPTPITEQTTEYEGYDNTEADNMQYFYIGKGWNHEGLDAREMEKLLI